MLLYRISVAVLCALLVSGAVLRAAPSCDRPALAGPSCCKDETTCPMHQKQGSGPIGFAACHGDGTDTSAVVVHHRAVLATGVIALDVPQNDRTFDTPVHFTPSADLVPRTPPPRLA